MLVGATVRVARAVTGEGGEEVDCAAGWDIGGYTGYFGPCVVIRLMVCEM